MTAGPTPLRIKILIALTSFTVSVTLLEGALRIIGGTLKNDHLNNFIKIDPGATRVLAIGDSFTNGGLVGRHEDYPYLLERHLNADAGGREGRFQVFNAGVCGASTHELLGFLPEWLERFRPHAVVILAGSANWFTLMGRRTIDDEPAGAWAPLARLFAGLRVVRTARALALEITARRMLVDRRARDVEGRLVPRDRAPITRWAAYADALGSLSRRRGTRCARGRARRGAARARLAYDGRSTEALLLR